MAKKAPVAQSRAVSGVIVGFAMKSVGERSAGNPHAAFDERGGETGSSYVTRVCYNDWLSVTTDRTGNLAFCRLQHWAPKGGQALAPKNNTAVRFLSGRPHLHTT